MNPVLFGRILPLRKKLSNSRKKSSDLQKKPSGLQQRHAANAFRKGILNCGIYFKDAYCINKHVNFSKCMYTSHIGDNCPLRVKVSVGDTHQDGVISCLCTLPKCSNIICITLYADIISLLREWHSSQWSCVLPRQPKILAHACTWQHLGHSLVPRPSHPNVCHFQY